MNVYHQYRKVLDDIESAQQVLEIEKDAAFRDMAKEELESLAQQQQVLDVHTTSKPRIKTRN